jgi:glycogen(starch) synthase
VAEIFDKRFVRGHVRSAASLALARFVSSFSNAIVCCSHTVAAQFHGTKRAPVVTIYPGVEPAPPGSGPAFRRRENLVDANPLLAVIGNISRGRGQDLIVRALPAIRERFPGTRCVIAGAPHQRPVDLAYRQELAALVDQLGQADSVVFVGFVDPISDVYAAADIVVNPARFNEPFGRVAIEALSAGTPVVAARVGAIAEVLLDGVGALLVEPDDPDRLAEAVTKLWADQELRTSLVERGRKDVERRFDVEASVAQFEAVVSTLVSDG